MCSISSLDLPFRAFAKIEWTPHVAFSMSFSMRGELGRQAHIYNVLGVELHSLFWSMQVSTSAGWSGERRIGKGKAADAPESSSRVEFFLLR